MSIERRFAEDIDGASEVCVYAKLPKRISIPAPVGKYSPDWAIEFYAGTVKHIFFIVETKKQWKVCSLGQLKKLRFYVLENCLMRYQRKMLYIMMMIVIRAY